MINHLNTLIQKLENSKLSESKMVEHIKLSITNPQQQNIRLFQSPEYKAKLLELLQALGLQQNQNNIVQIFNAAEYLSEGISENNLLLAGLSLISTMPNLQEIQKIISNINNVSAEQSMSAAELISKNQSMIKGILDKFKDQRFVPYVKKYIYRGDLLIQYSDRIWESINKWIQQSQKISTDVESLSENL